MVAFYQDFVTHAAEGRKKSFEDIDAVAQGRVWTGTEALSHGLVDRLGGLDVALGLAKERARIGKDQDVNLVVLPERKGFLETILERQEDGADAMVAAAPGRPPAPALGDVDDARRCQRAAAVRSARVLIRQSLSQGGTHAPSGSGVRDPP